MFEIGYVLFKRPSIFGVSTIIIINSAGLMLIYFITFGDTFASIVTDLSSTVTDEQFFGQRVAYVIIICLLLLPLVLKKQLQELKIISWILFSSLFIFILLTITQLGIDGASAFNPDFHFDLLKKYYSPGGAKFDGVNFLKCLSIIMVSFVC